MPDTGTDSWVLMLVPSSSTPEHIAGDGQSLKALWLVPICYIAIYSYATVWQPLLGGWLKAAAVDYMQ